MAAGTGLRTSDSELPFPIPEPTRSTRPASAPFAFELSVSQSAPRHDTSTTLNDLVREVTSRVPYPVIFIAGAAIGVLVASLVVAISRHGAPPPAAVTAISAPPPAALDGLAPNGRTWAPVPVVTIHPAPPAPPATASLLAPTSEPAPAAARTSQPPQAVVHTSEPLQPARRTNDPPAHVAPPPRASRHFALPHHPRAQRTASVSAAPSAEARDLLAAAL